MPAPSKGKSIQVARERLLRASTMLHSVSSVSREAFEALLTPRVFAVGEALLSGGQKASHCFFIDTGLVREFYLGADGAQHTRTFLAEGQLTGSLLDLISKRPAITCIEALEPTVTLAFAYAEFDTLCARYPDLQQVARRFAEALYVRKAQREHAMLAFSASERYAQWLREQPGLDRRIQRQHLASYLGVSPEHLSRLQRSVRTDRGA
jgi:CRP-like cAMP-binding protein